MKKYLLVLLILLSTGCGKKLTCTYKDSFEDVKISNKVSFNFKDNTYNQLDIMTFKSIDEAKDYYDDIKDYVEELNLVLNDNKIVSSINGTITEDKNDIKKKYESYDFKCR